MNTRERVVIGGSVVAMVLTPLIAYHLFSRGGRTTMMKEMIGSESEPEERGLGGVETVRGQAERTMPAPTTKSSAVLKPVLQLAPTERAAVLSAAQGKVRAIVSEKHSGTDRSMVLHVWPMTHTEAEVLGDHLLEQSKRRGGYVNKLIVSFYWRREVAEACVQAKKNAATQIYNSYLEMGGRVAGPNPTDFNDTTFFRLLVQEGWLLSPGRTRYDADTQILSMREAGVNSMMDLIWMTFMALGDSGRWCPFDWLPNLKEVVITYYDKDNEMVCSASYDVEYWCAMKQIEVVPQEVEREERGVQDELRKWHQAKLLSDEEYEQRVRECRQLYSAVAAKYYQKKWVELSSKMKDFNMVRSLRLGEDTFRW